MIIEKLLQPLRIRQADKLISLAQFEDAQALLIAILDKQPKGKRLTRVYGALAETEFARGHFLNSRYYAGLYLERSRAECPEGPRGAGQKELLKKVSWYYEESDRARLAARR